MATADGPAAFFCKVQYTNERTQQCGLDARWIRASQLPEAIVKRTASAIAALAFCFVASVGRADEVDEAMKTEVQKQKIPGASVAVIMEGRVVKAEGYGLANVELNSLATANTIYQSGSIGKQFTATLVMMLVEDGKIALDDKISKYMTDGPDTWKDITIRHLLTHTSGIKDPGARDLNYRLDYTDDQLVTLAGKSKLGFEPGEKRSYSNTGYVLLGILITKVTGKFYGDLLQERIFAPNGMETARIISEADIIPNRAAGYRLVGGQLKNQEYMSPSLNRTADGGLYFTVLDLAKWDAALNGKKLLKPENLELMWTPAKLRDGKPVPYGFGWALGGEPGHRIVSHGGLRQGFATHIKRYIDDHLTIVVLANRAGASPEAIIKKIEKFYLAK
jgi:CubicO group peptidase (beta-lactamase class C family)